MRIFSGIQPSGDLHIGNYLGAIKQFIELQKSNEAIFCIVDLHAITVPQDPKVLYEKTLEVAMLYIASGLDPKKSTLFVQSHIPAHTELSWILNTITPLGELERMTQFKDKSKDQSKRKGVFAGLLNYPTLMAADILLYGSEGVPVGKDQIQHIEFTRMLAERFNSHFGEQFIIPKPLLKKETARIMGLDDPSKKMSKSSESEYHAIALLDSPEQIEQKIKAAVTDSGSEIIFDEMKKPAISNLLQIYHGLTDKSISNIEVDYQNKGYSEFKKDLVEIIIEELRPIREKMEYLKKDQNTIIEILEDGEKKASLSAGLTLYEVKEKMGFLV